MIGMDQNWDAERKAAEEKIYRKGYCTANMVYDKTRFELYNKKGEVVIDNLSAAQLIQLADLL